MFATPENISPEFNVSHLANGIQTTEIMKAVNIYIPLGKLNPHITAKAEMVTKPIYTHDIVKMNITILIHKGICSYRLCTHPEPNNAPNRGGVICEIIVALVGIARLSSN